MLNNESAWLAKSGNEYSQTQDYMIINLGSLKQIRGVVTQMLNHTPKHYVKTFKVFTSENSTGPWVQQTSTSGTYLFLGPVEPDSIYKEVEARFENAVNATFVKIQPVEGEPDSQPYSMRAGIITYSVLLTPIEWVDSETKQEIRIKLLDDEEKIRISVRNEQIRTWLH